MANKRQKLARKQYKEAHPELFPTPQLTPAKDPDKKKKKKNSKFKRKREGSKELKSPNNGYKKGIRKHPLRVPGMRPGESCYICKAKDHIAKLCPQKAQWEKHMICLHCRQRGHSLKNCTEVMDKKTCYNCGEAGHSLSKCPQPLQDGGTKFAQCFVCKEAGHLSKNCPKNTHGIYPKGGCCKICGGVTHLAKDCPDKGKRASMSASREAFGTGERPTGKVTKFSSGDDLEDDFIIQESESATNDAKIKSKNQKGPATSPPTLTTMAFTFIFCFIAPFLFIFLFHSLLLHFFKPNRPKLPLPPGTMGWPYIGETFHLYSQNPNVFFASKQQRYGSIFKTHILGCPCVMMSSPDAAKFVLVTKSHLFKPTFPASKERMLGKQAIFFNQGPYHAKLRKLVLRAFMPDSIKNIVPNIESIAKHSLHSLQGRLITTFQEMKTYTFNVALLSIFGKDDQVLYREDLKRCYYILEKGYNSMPINLPGTLFNKSMKARKEIAQILAKIISTRRQTKQVDCNDLLGSFMRDKEGLTDEQIADNVIGVIFAARDTTASVITWIIKYLGENPSVLQAVTEEQEAIIRGKEEQELSWEDTKKMPLTSRVIQETLRVASILSFTFREAVEDVEYEGYLIPKGWKVLPLFRNIHHSPEIFPDPQKFDPSRFEVAPKPNTFMPFGNGTHSCPGNELAKLEIMVLLHHLTTKYRWSMVGSNSGIQYGPFALPQNGLPIRLVRK